MLIVLCNGAVEIALDWDKLFEKQSFQKKILMIQAL